MGLTTYPNYTQVASGSSLPVNATVDYWLELARGNLSGLSVVHKFGRNDAVPNGSWAGILQLASLFTWLSTATTVRVKSGGNANDTAAGTGAQAVTVEGLDETGAAASEDIELAGNSASSATTTTFIRVFRSYIADDRVGTYAGSNVGDIGITDSVGNDLIKITAGEGQTQYCAYTIPLGKTGYLMSAIVQADASKAADFRLYTRKNILDVSTPYAPARLKFYWDGVLGQAPPLRPVTPALVLPALTDIWIEARGGGAGTEVSGDMEIVLIND